MERKKRTYAYDGTMPERAYKLCLLGLTNEDLAIAFGVTVKAVEYWIKWKDKFRRAVELGREEADSKVAEALYKRAVGYTHKDTDIKMYKGQVILTEVEKHYPPETSAAIFWLKNRQKEHWADVWKMEHSQSPELADKQNDLSELTDEELQLAIKLGVGRFVNGKEDDK